MVLLELLSLLSLLSLLWLLLVLSLGAGEEERRGEGIGERAG